MKTITFIGTLLLTLAVCQTRAATCPDPATSSLQWGDIPAPWVIAPSSDHDPQGDKTTRFVNAKIMVAGVGRGVVCNYKNAVGFYSIWWPVSVKLPSRMDNRWIESYMGYTCYASSEVCVFYTSEG
jgi:hypothetical protein